MTANAGLNEINEYLSLVDKTVDSINDDNFDERIKFVNSLIAKIDKKKKELKNATSQNEYKYICDVLHTGVKQISSKFDGIIEDKREEQKVISSELSKVMNKKKLINYQR